jgi:integrase
MGKVVGANGLAPLYIQQIVGTLSTIFMAAMDDGIVARNPVRTNSVTLPKIPRRKVVPWTLEQVSAAAESIGGRDACMAFLDARAALRQGEIFGIAVEDIEFIGGRLIHVRRKVRLIDKQLVFALPKGRQRA